MTSPTNGRISTAVLVAAIGAAAAITCTVVAAVVVLHVYAPASRNPAAAIGLLVGLVGSTLPTVVLLVQQAKTSERVKAIAPAVEDLTNGLMDSKIRAAVADVIHDAAIDPAVRGQLDADRRRRDRAEA